ncbi:MAG: type IV-A pilus assembly ATPase PilB [bacterium]
MPSPQELGTLLVEAGKISDDQLTLALARLKDNNTRLEDVLVDIGAFSDPDDVSAFIGKQLNIGAIRLSDIELNPDIVKLIPVDLARKFNVIAVSKIGKTLVVAVSDPNNVYVLDAIKFITGFSVQPVMSPEKAIRKAIEHYYSDQAEYTQILQGLEDSDLQVIDPNDDAPSELDLQSAVQDKPLVKLVDSIITEAIRKGASDIHIETYERRIRVRYRIDGALQEMSPLPFKYRAAIVSRVKIMADLDISERRLPQDGRIKIKVGDHPVDLRVSVLPTIYGEKVVMRILDPKALQHDLTKLGFPEIALKQFDKAIHLPYGIVLVTGPTGSGKTTTLYSALRTINTVDTNIMTVEDPVEFNFDGINQVAVRTDIGLSFSAALRSFLRQDPDVILLGEIRDGETAEIAIRAALTGHLVFSTLHTNDAPSSIARLIDMGIPSFLVASATKLIMAQRMTRKICQACKEKVEVDPEILLSLGIPEVEIGMLEIYRGRGCNECNQTGYAGRTGLFEVMSITPEVEKLILTGAPTSEVLALAIDQGMSTLRMAGIDKIRRGITTVEEVLAKTT